MSFYMPAPRLSIHVLVDITSPESMIPVGICAKYELDTRFPAKLWAKGCMVTTTRLSQSVYLKMRQIFLLLNISFARQLISCEFIFFSKESKSSFMQCYCVYNCKCTCMYINVLHAIYTQTPKCECTVYMDLCNLYTCICIKILHTNLCGIIFIKFHLHW